MPQDIFDLQEEPDKTVMIQSALLLGSAWYIDLEDRDGMWSWIGVALNLSFTIGLHRRDNYDSIVPVRSLDHSAGYGSACGGPSSTAKSG